MLASSAGSFMIACLHRGGIAFGPLVMCYSRATVCKRRAAVGPTMSHFHVGST